jgi:protein TonB
VRAHRREEARKTDAEDASEQAMANPRQALSGATHESDKLPVPISGNPRPAYPLDARRRGYEGRVHVEVAVSASGAVARAVIKKSSGYRSLDQAALQAVARWQFRPAERGGKATEHMLEIPIVFRLRTPSG